MSSSLTSGMPLPIDYRGTACGSASGQPKKKGDGLKIVICASVDFTPQIRRTKEALEKMGHEVTGMMEPVVLDGDLSRIK